jgi:WD40 repeat protein
VHVTAPLFYPSPPPPYQVLFLNDRLTPEGGMLFAGDSTGAVYQWDIGRLELVSSWKGHEGSVWELHMATFALISGGLDGMVKLWDPRTRELIRQLYKHTSSVCSFSVQANVFYSCAVDNIIKVWDWKDGTCLGTMHGHRETVANLCLTPEGTLFSSGIDKMVKVWKPPGSWGEEWHGLRELDLTTSTGLRSSCEARRPSGSRSPSRTTMKALASSSK